MIGALAGIRVVDLTRILAGPFCTMMLGDMGAEIVKVEPPGRGDDTRAWGPPFAAGESTYFLAVNRNKRSLTLNLASPAGRAVLEKLIERADVLVDNFKLGTLAKWSFTDDWFEKYAPQLVRCQITGYGSTGPKAALPGYDYVLQAESGLMSISGEPDSVPTKHGIAIVDVCTGMLACNAILGALNARHRTGKGQKVEVSLYESSLAMLVNIAASCLATGKDSGRFGNGHPNIVPYRTYPTADAAIVLAVGNDGQFARTAEILGHPEWAKDARFATNRARVENRNVIDGMIAEAFRRGSAQIWVEKLRGVGVPCGVTNSVMQALESPQTAARRMIETMPHPTIGELKMLSVPFKFSDTPAKVRRVPPTLGQHTTEILGELGMSADAIARLRAEKVV